MKLMHTTTTELNTREFNKVSDKIIDALYELSPEVQELYDIHINFIEDEWVVDFLPASDDIPVIKVDTYTENDDRGREYLKLKPKDLSDIPELLSFKNEDKTSELCMNYVSIFEFILALYDFEYKL